MIELDYAEVLVRTFDDVLEKVGTTGDRYQRYTDAISTALASERHGKYQEGLECLGKLLGYTAVRPSYGTATDCLWRGVFGNAREVVTFEAKIEDTPSGKISASDLGQAHNQRHRAESEYGQAGYIVRATIVTHLADLHGDAASSVGPIRILGKDAVSVLWDRIRVLLSTYRDSWSLDDVRIRSQAAAILRPYLPKTGWLVRALDAGTPFVSVESLLSEWKAS